MKKQDTFRAGTGASSIMMVFVILCLTTLAVLSFLSARADQHTTDRVTEQAGAYYAARAAVEEKIAVLDAGLYGGDTAYTPGDLIELEAPMGDGRYVRARVRILALGQTGPRYEIVEYRTVDMREWNPSGSGNGLWEGE